VYLGLDICASGADYAATSDGQSYLQGKITLPELPDLLRQYCARRGVVKGFGASEPTPTQASDPYDAIRFPKSAAHSQPGNAFSTH